jgi:hypothetical protein
VSSQEMDNSEYRPQALTIPTTSLSVAQFIEEAEAFLLQESTHIYLDTSFLVLLTTLGKDARREFLGWMEKLGIERFHIPIWAGHEFLTHHVQDMIGDMLTSTASKLNTLADSTYGLLRPFLDEPIAGDGRSPQELQVYARDTLVQLKHLANQMTQWKGQHYEEHFNEVANLIAEIGLKGRGIFDFMSDIDVLERNRFTGRIPPGFQDRRKKERDDVDGKSTIGSNRYGDLVFWREVLQHASNPTITGIAILSNDRKNDWHMGGEIRFDIEGEFLPLRHRWTPIPVIHPMLALEASNSASISKVILLDSAYLGLLLHKSGVAAKRFVDAVLTAELPAVKTLMKQQRKEAVRDAQATQRSKEGIDRATTLGMEDGPEVSIAEPQLKRAAITRTISAIVEEFLSNALDVGAAGRPITEFLNSSFLPKASTVDLVRLGRSLHSEASAATPLASFLLTDLIALLPQLPSKTATCLYLGILVSIYFDDTNGIRLPPESLCLSQALRWQEQPFAEPALRILSARLKLQERQPVYVPSLERNTISIQPLTRTEAAKSPQPIVGLQVNGVELLTQAQGDCRLQLKTLLQNVRPVSVRQLVNLACKLFGLPDDRIEEVAILDQVVDYEALTGFQAPSQVYRTAEE